jgi:DNA-binding transcriptional MerR regulator
MFTIGDFARHGRVSIRMLRHYDAIGLLRPAHVDEVTGYRFYRAAQLARLNRVIALKDLGFTLQQVGGILDEQVGAEELRGMLTLRHADLHARIAADTARLGQVEARLRAIESEGQMPTEDVVVKELPAIRLAELTGTAAGLEPESITPVVRPLCEELGKRFANSGLTSPGPLITYYTDADGDGGGRPGRTARPHGRRPAWHHRSHHRAPRFDGHRADVDPDAGPLDRCPGPPVGRLPA